MKQKNQVVRILTLLMTSMISCSIYADSDLTINYTGEIGAAGCEIIGEEGKSVELPTIRLTKDGFGYSNGSIDTENTINWNVDVTCYSNIALEFKLSGDTDGNNILKNQISTGNNGGAGNVGLISYLVVNNTEELLKINEWIGDGLNFTYDTSTTSINFISRLIQTSEDNITAGKISAVGELSIRYQ